VAISRWFHYQYLKLVRIDDSPRKIALGAAVGVFLGVFPTFGVGTILAFALAVIFRFNRAAAILGSFIMNPLTTPFFWALSASVGTAIFGGNYRTIVADFQSGKVLKAAGMGIVTYLVGNLLISGLLALITYPLVLKGVEAYRRKRQRRRPKGA